MWCIEDRLFLGDYRSGYAALGGVRHPVAPSGDLAPFAGVLSLCPMPLFPDEPLDGPVADETEWLATPIHDGGSGEREFEQAVSVALPFIDRRIRDGNVLVHCAAGMSRSVSIIAAMFCRRGMPVDDAYAAIAARKAAALPGVDVEARHLIAPAQEFRSCLKRLFSQ